MAVNCYNLIQFFGNTKVKEQVKAWKKTLDIYEHANKDTHNPCAIKEVFYPNYQKGIEPTYGSEWVLQDNETLSPDVDELGLVSSKINPSELEQHLACLLFTLDKNVIVRNNFNSENGTVGVSYSSPYDQDNCYYQSAVVEAFQTEDEEDINDKLAEQEIEMLSYYFLDDMPHLVKVIKKHMPKINLDWDDLK